MPKKPTNPKIKTVNVKPKSVPEVASPLPKTVDKTVPVADQKTVVAETEGDQEYLKDHKGRLVPEDLIPEIDKFRDSLVREIVNRSLDLQVQLLRFKTDTMADVDAFVALSLEKYGVKMGGRKGNLSLISFDGTLRVQVAVQEYQRFDERLQGAKELIDQCIRSWTQDSRNEIKALINDAFQVDQEGRINTNRILGLRRLNIVDERWQQAMQAISDSLQTIGSKTYLRIHQRDPVGKWQPISLDIASL